MFAKIKLTTHNPIFFRERVDMMCDLSFWILLNQRALLIIVVFLFLICVFVCHMSQIYLHATYISCPTFDRRRCDPRRPNYSRSLLLAPWSFSCMSRMDQITRNHIHTHLPLLGGILPTALFESVFLLTTDLILSNFHAGGVHLTMLCGS